MKTLTAIFLVLCVIAHAVAAQSAPPSDPRLTPAERDRVVSALTDSHSALLKEVESLSDEQWNFRPAPFKWTVGETAEHIALSEGLLFQMVERALAAPANPDWEAKSANKDRLLEGVLAGRMGKAQAPEPIQPLRKKMSRSEIMSLIKEGRAKTLRFARETTAELKSHTADHPFPVFGTLNAYQWLYYIPMHNLRHNKQITEIKANAAFPK